MEDQLHRLLWALIRSSGRKNSPKTSDGVLFLPRPAEKHQTLASYSCCTKHTGLMGNDRLLFLKTYSYIYPLTWVFLPRVSTNPSMHRDISGHTPAQRPSNPHRHTSLTHTHTHTHTHTPAVCENLSPQNENQTFIAVRCLYLFILNLAEAAERVLTPDVRLQPQIWEEKRAMRWKFTLTR